VTCSGASGVSRRSQHCKNDEPSPHKECPTALKTEVSAIAELRDCRQLGDCDLSCDPKRFDGFDRPDETPKTLAELKPPGYWSKAEGRFVDVRQMTPEDIDKARRKVS
jgi:hypothetical protein